MDQPQEKPSQAIARPNQTPSIIRTPEDYRASVQRWSAEHFHVLSPVANFSGMPDHFGLVAALVTINNDPAGGEVYQDNLFCEKDEVAMAKPGLAKIAQAGGMTIRTERTDPRTIQHYWEVRATLRFTGLDGTPQEIDNTAEYDLRDDSPRVQKMIAAARKKGRDAAAQIMGARMYGLRGCEARAINAAIRQFGIRQKYHKAELIKPFVMVRVVFLPDMTDAATKRQVTERALAGTTQLYPQAPAAPGYRPDVIDVIGGAAPAGESAAPPAPASREVFGVEHDLEAGVYELALDGGELLVTRSGDVATAALAAKKAGQRVLLTMGEEDGQPVIVTLTVAAAAPVTSNPPATAPTLPLGATTITKVERVKGTKGDRPWTRYDVTFASGQVASTFSESLHQLIDDAEKQKTAVRIRTVATEGYNDKLEALEIVNSRQQALPGTEY